MARSRHMKPCTLGINLIMKRAKSTLAALLEPFRSGKGLDIPLVLVFLTINGLVFVNACLHDPKMQYDGGAHLHYINALSELRLVTPDDSVEFFSPPLPYVLPALFVFLTNMPVLWAAKLGQFLNVLLSVGLTFYLIKTCHLISPRSSLKLGALMFLGIFPVYYKTFAFVRGEPYVVFFAVVIMYYTLLISIEKRFTTVNAIILGVAMGLCALSRQWGILLFPSVFLFLGFEWIRLPQWRRSIAKTICLCLALITLISGWFYISLRFRYGSSIAFNREPAEFFSFHNQPVEFYVGLSPKFLFDRPVRPNFANQFLPIFYSELWGDYWGYFSVYAKDTRVPRFISGWSLNKIRISSEGSQPSWVETNYATMGAYLGRVNLVSIFPSALVLIALVYAVMGTLRRSSNDSVMIHRREITGLLLLAIATTLLGYFWFLLAYPNIEGDTIKATYILHVLPFVAILVANLLEHIKKRTRFLYRFILVGLSLSFAHNIFAMVTHYSLLRLL